MRIPCSSDGASCSTPDTIAADCTIMRPSIPAHVRRYTKTFYYSKDMEVINFFVEICHDQVTSCRSTEEKLAHPKEYAQIARFIREYLEKKRDGRLSRGIRHHGPTGIRTRVLGFEAQEDIHYPMDPPASYHIKDRQDPPSRPFFEVHRNIL